MIAQLRRGAKENQSGLVRRSPDARPPAKRLREAKEGGTR